MSALTEVIAEEDTQRFREELQHGRAESLRRRRTVIGLSMLGMVSLGVVSLYQTGIINHMPDPPIEGFDSDKVNASKEAFQYGVPDGPLSVLSSAVNVPLAALGGADRAQEHPWIPLIAAGKAAVDAVAAGWYFYEMPAREHAWCGWCITGALANFGIFASALPEAREALRAIGEG